MQTLQRRRCQTRTRPRKKVCVYGARVSGAMLGEYDANQTPIYETIYLNDSPVGVLKQTGTAAGSNIATSTYNVYSDHLATPRVITRQSDEAIVWRWDTAEAFGATAPNQNPNALGGFVFNQRFPGQVFDAETGLFQNWHREYNARLGRYIQSDPIGLAGGINTYAYVGGNPVSRTDPTGLLSRGECKKLRDDIYRKNGLLQSEFAKYDPVLDGQGGFPMKYGSGFTKAGGHFQEMKDLQRGLKKDLKRYNDECKCDDDDDGTGPPNAPITRNVDALANKPIPPPVFPSMNMPSFNLGDSPNGTSNAAAGSSLFLLMLLLLAF